MTTAFETITKKTKTGKARCPHAISNLGKEVRQCWLLCREKDVTSMTVPNRKKRYLQSYINHPAVDLSQIMVLNNAKTHLE